MFDSYAVPEAPIGGHLYRQQVGVKVILASMQQKVGISVTLAGTSLFSSQLVPYVRTLCAPCVRVCVHYVCTMCARCMHDVPQHIVVVRAYSARS